MKDRSRWWCIHIRSDCQFQIRVLSGMRHSFGIVGIRIRMQDLRLQRSLRDWREEDPLRLYWIELNTLHFYEEFFHVLLFVVSRKLRNGLVCVGESKEKEAFSFKEWNKQARTSIATQSRAIGSWRSDVRLMFVHKTDKLGSNIYKITSNSSNELCTFLSLTLLNESGNIMSSSLGISKSSITRKNELSRCTSQAK